MGSTRVSPTRQRIDVAHMQDVHSWVRVIRRLVRGENAGARSDDDRASMFHLLKYFSVTSAIAFLVVSVSLIAIDRAHEFDKIIESVERQNVGIAHSFGNVVWPKFAGYSTPISDGVLTGGLASAARLHDEVLRLTGGLPILKINIYDPYGVVVYSTNPREIGNVKEDNLPLLASARNGVPKSKYLHRHVFDAVSGPVDHRDMVESYLPILGVGGNVDGELEIYTDVSTDILILGHKTRETALIVGTVFLALYLLLVAIVKRADRVVARQYASVVRSRERLNEKNAALMDEISQRRRLMQDLQVSEQRYRELSDRLINAQEEERTRIARELHDGVGQGLTGMKYRIERVASRMTGRQNREAREDLEATVCAIQRNMEEIRSIAMGLRPSMLDDLGILATLAWSCRTFRNTYRDIDVIQNVHVAETAVPDALKTVVYRTLQEAMNNVAKHAQATRIRVGLVRRGERICFTISDNGRGIAGSHGDGVGDVRPRLGLVSLRERAMNFGCAFRLRSIKGIGTSISISWPLPVAEQPAAPARRNDRSGKAGSFLATVPDTARSVPSATLNFSRLSERKSADAIRLDASVG